MKKILLGTSGLFGAVALFASAAAAGQTPTVTVGGFIDFQAGIVDEDNDATTRAHGFRNDSEVSIRVDGKSDSGLGYGAVIDLEADVTADADNEGLNAARTYIFLDGGWGRFELGSNTGAAEAMKLDASNIARATGGIDGAWSYFAQRPAAGGNFITAPSLVVGHGSVAVTGDESFDNNNKITYYSPRFSGFQLGLSYSPDLSDRGQTVSRTDTNDAEDLVNVALSYEGSWDEATLGFAAAYETGDAERTTGVEDVAAWNVGLSAGFSGLTVAGSYGDWGDSLAASGTDQNYWTAGAAYDFGPFGTSVTYLASEVEVGATSNEFSNLSFGADYTVAPGLAPYAEVSLFEFDGAGTGTADNDGTAVIIGTQLAF